MNNAVFGKAMENKRTHKDIKLVTTEKKNKLFGARTKESYYKVYTENLLAIEIKKTEILMNKPIYLKDK